MQSDIALLEREGIANGTYRPLHHAAILMKQRGQDPSDLLDRVLQMSNGDMFVKIREEFPEYIDGIATRMVGYAREFADAFTDQDIKDIIYETIVGPLAPHNFNLAKELADSLSSPPKQNWAYAQMATGLTLTNPSKAIRLADKIDFPLYKETAYLGIAIQLTLTNLPLALEVADKILNPYTKADTYCAMALEFIPDNYDQAIQIANKIYRTKCLEKAHREIEKKLNPQPDEELIGSLALHNKGIRDHNSTLVSLTRSAKFEDLESLFRTEPYEGVVDFCIAIRGLTQDAI